MILSSPHFEGESVYLLVFRERPRFSVIQEIQNFIDSEGIEAEVRVPQVVISRREGIRRLFKLLNANEEIDPAYQWVKLELKRSEFSAGAVRDYLEMVTGWEWCIDGVRVTGDVIEARFRCSGGCE